MKTIGEYEVISKIGVGGAGVVYKAKHLQSGDVVAIKTFSPPDGLKPKTLEKLSQRFSKEIELLRSLNHKSIVRFIDEINSDTGHYYVMEYVDNIAPKIGEKWPIDFVVDVVIQLAKALSYAHEKGIIHRDIKPENILVAGTLEKPECKLTDFGIAYKEQEVSKVTVTGEIVGTFFYMSPEQIESRKCTQKTDIYALGLVMYEFLTGKRVHDGNTPAKVIGQIMLSSPPPPSFFRSEIPESLDRLILRCIRRDEEARFNDARELIHELETLKAIGYDGSRTRQFSLQTQFSPLVGRDKELSKLTHLLADVKNGTPKFVYLIGPTGIGKTRLAGELVSVARSWGVRYVSVSVTRNEARNPFGVIAKVAEKLVDEKVPDEKWVKVGLASLSTSLSKKLDTTPPKLGSKELFYLIEDAFVWLLKDRCKNSSILVTVDDSQWADYGSAVITEKIIKYVDDIGLYVVFAVNTDMVSHDSGILKMIERTKSGCERIRLRQFDNLDVERYIKNMLGISDIPPQLLEFIFKEAGGNPLYIGELLRFIIKKGGIRNENGKLKVVQSELSVPDKVLKYQNLAISNLDEVTANLITIAAVIGPTFSAQLLATVSGTKIFDVHSRLDKALSNQILRVSMSSHGNMYSFSHEQMRINIVNSTSLHFRQGISQKTAQAMESMYADRIENHLERLIYHHLNSLTPTMAIPYMLRAGRFSEGKFHHKEASGLASKALHLAEENSIWKYVTLSYELFADISSNMGKADDAHKYIEEAYKLLDRVEDFDNSEKARILRKCAGYKRIATGNIFESTALVEEGLSLLEDSTEFEEIANLEMAYASYIKDPTEALKHIEKSEQILDQIKSFEALIICYGIKANLLRKMGKVKEAVEVLEQAEKIGEDNGLESSLEGIFATLASIMFNRLSDVSRGKEYAMKARRLASRTGNLELVGFMNFVEAMQLYGFGYLTQSEKLLIEAMEIWESLGQKPRLYSTAVMLGWLYLEFGDYKKGFEYLNRSKAFHKSIDPNGFDMELVNLEIELLIKNGNMDKAMILAQETLKNLDEQSVTDKVNFYYSLATLYIENENIKDAWKYIRKSRELLSGQKNLYMDFVILISYAKILTQILQKSKNENYLSKVMTLAGTGLLGKDLLSLIKSVYEDAFISALNGGNKLHVVRYYLEHCKFLRENLKYTNFDLVSARSIISLELSIAKELVCEISHPRIESEILAEIQKT